MKIKQFVMIAAVIAVLLASYILPRQMLRYERDRAMQIVQTENLSEALSLNYNMTLAEKLQLLTQTDTQTVVFEMSTEEKANVISMMQQELMELKEIGFADTAMMIDVLLESDENFEVYNVVYIDAERILRAYQVLQSELFVVMDVDSGKILKITAYDACWERAEAVLNSQTKGETLALRDLESWAKYYEMQLVDSKISHSYLGKDHGWAIASGYFVDEKGSRVCFAINFDIRDGVILWGAVEEELLVAEREAVEEIEE